MLPVAPVEPLAAMLDAREGRRVASGSCAGEMRAPHKARPPSTHSTFRLRGAT
jgi:hypothetical protein